jgi:hypothetical protein
MRENAFYLLYAGFFFGSFVDPEDGSDMILRNLRLLSTDYTALQTGRYKSSGSKLFYYFILLIY